MPKTDPKLKDQLMDEGRWGEFVKYRQDLKFKGHTNMEAHQMALDKFFDNPPVKEKKKAASKKSSKKSSGGGEPNPPAPPPKGSSPPIYPTNSVKGSANERPREPKVKAHPGDLPRLPAVRSGDFDGKKASEVEAIRWVADNMQILDPKPKDCPSAAAWGLLAQCRDSAIAQSDFWKQTFPKLLPSRTQMEQERDAAPDESKAKEVIEDLLRFGRKAKEEEVEEAGTIDLPEPREEAKEDENGMEVVEEEETVATEWKKG